jgi:hypothetical protein
MIRRFLIRLNNVLVRWREPHLTAEELLLLAPRCLQRSGCGRPVVQEVDACVRCGKCTIGALLALRDELGIRLCVAGGGRQALASVRGSEVKGVVAVACEPELLAGIRAAFPKPVLAVANRRPHGPCRDTGVELGDVRATIVEMLSWNARNGARRLAGSRLNIQQ